MPNSMPDMIDLASAQIVNAPDVRSWPITTALTQVSFDGSVTRVDFTKKNGPDRWPDLPFGQPGDSLQYTLWLWRHIGGQWVGSAFIQFWFGRDGSGSSGDPDVPSVYDQHWYYSSRWAPLYGSGPIHSGETIGFMVSAGNGRDNTGPLGNQRSNIVTFLASDQATYNFGAEPVPVPTPPPAPPSDVDMRLTAIEKDLSDIKVLIAALKFPNYKTTIYGTKIILTPA